MEGETDRMSVEGRGLQVVGSSKKSCSLIYYKVVTSIGTKLNPNDLQFLDMNSPRPNIKQCMYSYTFTMWSLSNGIVLSLHNMRLGCGNRTALKKNY